MLDGLKQRLREHEGVIPYLYLDTVGLVTTGVGHLLSTSAYAEALPFNHPDGRLATCAEIHAEYAAVEALEPAKLPGYYAERTKLRLPDSAVAELQDRDLQVFAAALESRLPAFQNYPAPAQEALLDMAFQLGVAGLCREFPYMMQAVRLMEWNDCAELCHRAGIQEWRNTDTAELFRWAARGRRE